MTITTKTYTDNGVEKTKIWYQGDDAIREYEAWSKEIYKLLKFIGEDMRSTESDNAASFEIMAGDKKYEIIDYYRHSKDTMLCYHAIEIKKGRDTIMFGRDILVYDQDDAPKAERLCYLFTDVSEEEAVELLALKMFLMPTSGEEDDKVIGEIIISFKEPYWV